MVVRTPQIDDALEATLELLHVVGNVRSEVGGLTILANDNAVFFVAELRCAKPDRAVLVVGMPGGAQTRDGAVDGAAGDQRSLRVPAVEGHAELFQVLANLGQLAVQGESMHGLEGSRAEQFLCAADERVDVGLLVAALTLVRGQISDDVPGFLLIDVAVPCLQRPT